MALQHHVEAKVGAERGRTRHKDLAIQHPDRRKLKHGWGCGVEGKIVVETFAGVAEDSIPRSAVNCCNTGQDPSRQPTQNRRVHRSRPNLAIAPVPCAKETDALRNLLMMSRLIQLPRRRG